MKLRRSMLSSVIAPRRDRTTPCTDVLSHERGDAIEGRRTGSTTQLPQPREGSILFRPSGAPRSGEPGIHNFRRSEIAPPIPQLTAAAVYGFRARGLRPRPGM